LKAKVFLRALERYFPEEPSSESIIIFLPSKRTITGAGLTLTLASLIPAHLSIKTPEDNDWFAQGNVLQQTQNLDNFGERLNASIVVYSDSHYPEQTSRYLLVF
jgi:hypothetical protein